MLLITEPGVTGTRVEQNDSRETIDATKRNTEETAAREQVLQRKRKFQVNRDAEAAVAMRVSEVLSSADFTDSEKKPDRKSWFRQQTAPCRSILQIPDSTSRVKYGNHGKHRCGAVLSGSARRP